MRGKRVYFDANIFIYLVEGFAEMAEKIDEISDGILHGESTIFTSELTLCEVLVTPFRNGDGALVAQYRQLIETSGAFVILPTARETYVRASQLRAQLGLKTPDAIHLATALEGNCDAFVTNDRPLKAPEGIEMIRI